MTIAEWILLPTLGLAFYNVGIIWLMQVHVYPLFKLVGEDEWIPYHTAHWHRIRGVVFVPAGLVLLGAILLMFFRPEAVPGWSLWLGLGVQVVLYALTAVVWAPMQIRLSEGDRLHPRVHETLLRTHWGRVALITLYALLVLWMTVAAFAGRGA